MEQKCEYRLTEGNKNDLIRLKQYFPYRIVFGVVMPDGKFDTYASTTKHKMNKFLRLGYPVFQAN